jgi:non-specific serine/threonine protein kinase
MESRGWLDRIAREADNLRTALGWARDRVLARREKGGANDTLAAAAALEAGLRLTGTMVWFWVSFGPLAECRTWAEGFLALDGATTTATDPHSTETEPPNRAALAVRARVLFAAGMMARLQGDSDQAVPPLERSLALYRTLGDRVRMRFPLLSLGLAREAQGDLVRATALYEESLALGRELHGPPGAMDALQALSRLALAAGDLDLAEERSKELLTLGLQVDNLEFQAVSLDLQALIAFRRGQSARAAAAARKVVELLSAAADVLDYDTGFEICAIVLLGMGQAEQAARLLGAAEAHRERVGSAPPRVTTTPSLEDVETATAQAQAALGDEVWAAAYAAGRALSTEEAIAEALKISPQSATLPHVDFSRIANRRK